MLHEIVDDKTLIKNSGSAADFAIIMLDTHGCVCKSSPSLQKFLGWRRIDIAGAWFACLFDPKQHDAVFFEQLLIRACGSDVIERAVCRHQNGSLKTVEMILSPLHDDDDVVCGYGLQLHDVQRIDTLEAMVCRLDRTAVLGQLAAGVAHDFNNVLQIVSASAAMITDNPYDGKMIQRCARRITLASNRGSTIAERILGFTRQETQVEFDVQQMFTDIQELVGIFLPTNINVLTFIETDALSIHADKAQCETVLVNLITNARDAMQCGGGTLTLSANPVIINESDFKLTPGRYVRITIADTGSGIDAKTIKRVMEPFFTTKPKGQGTGLGLSMAKDFVRRSGGALEIASKSGISTEVRLLLPQA